MSINHFLDKIKGSQGIQAIDKMAFVYLLMIAGLGIAAFGLGRLSVGMQGSSDSDIIFTQTPGMSDEISGQGNSQSQEASAASSASFNAPAKNYVASKNGKLYYSAGCTGAKRIKPANQVWFASVTQAEGLGYTLAPSCK